MEKSSKILNSHNPKVIAMLSGGKDSVAAIIILKKYGIDVTAIHFIHSWGSSIPTEEAKRICSLYKIPLIIKDYTKEFCDAINGYTSGRPCLLCKKEMYKLLLKTIKYGEYGWLCIGDNMNDKTTIARIKQYIENGHNTDSLLCSGYFGTELGIKLHKNMKVIRPLINMNTADIELFFKKENVNIKRINSTGDKYFEYHREGCPIQFADFGVSLNENLYESLKKYNDCITEYARKEGILASIHMPSTFIVTVPKGYEQKAAVYLENRGFYVDENINSNTFLKDNIITSIVHDIDSHIYVTNAYNKIFERFLERMELYSKNKKVIKQENRIFCMYESKNESFYIKFDFEKNKVEIQYIYKEDVSKNVDLQLFENLIIELFRTRKYQIHKC